MLVNLIEEKLIPLIDISFDILSLNNTTFSKYIQSLCYDRIIDINDSSVVLNDEEKVMDIIYDNSVYKLDIKFYNMDTKSFMVPNIISIDKARKFLSSDKNHIIYVFVHYKIENDILTILDIIVKKIENINWDCLTIQNLGKGQLQFKNLSEPITFIDNLNKKEWINILKSKAIEYYDKMILKITEYKMELDKDEYLDN